METVLGGTFELFGGKEAHFVYKPKKKSHTGRASSYKQFIKAASRNYFKRGTLCRETKKGHHIL